MAKKKNSRSGKRAQNRRRESKASPDQEIQSCSPENPPETPGPLFPDLSRFVGLMAVSLVAGVLLMMNARRHEEPSMNSSHGWPMIYLVRQSDLVAMDERAYENVHAWPFPAQEKETRTFSLMNLLTNLILAAGILAATYALASRFGRRLSGGPAEGKRKPGRKKARSASDSRQGKLLE